MQCVCSYTTLTCIRLVFRTDTDDLTGGVRRGKGAMVISHTCFAMRRPAAAGPSRRAVGMATAKRAGPNWRRARRGRGSLVRLAGPRQLRKGPVPPSPSPSGRRPATQRSTPVFYPLLSSCLHGCCSSWLCSHCRLLALHPARTAAVVLAGAAGRALHPRRGAQRGGRVRRAALAEQREQEPPPAFGGKKVRVSK